MTLEDYKKTVRKKCCECAAVDEQITGKTGRVYCRIKKGPPCGDVCAKDGTKCDCTPCDGHKLNNTIGRAI